MADQAENLRQIIRGESNRDFSKKEYKPYHIMRILTVTSGKGGVGKSSFSVNFAISLARQGKKVMILDADFGLANIDILMGITTKNNLSGVISGGCTMQEAVSTGPEGVQFISGGSGMRELIGLKDEELARVLDEFSQMEHSIDYLIIDTGAGVNEHILRMIDASDETILVMTPEPTSMMDSFALVKAIDSRQLQSDIKLVINRCDSKKEADLAATSFSNIAEKYLQLTVSCIGSLPFDKAVVDAVKEQRPFCLGSSPAARDMGRLTESYLHIGRRDEGEQRGIKRFFALFRK